MDTIVQIAGYSEAVFTLTLMAAIAIGSLFVKKPYELEDKKDETATA